MKKFLIAMTVGWSLAASLQGQPANVYPNYGSLNAPVNIDATRFENFDTIIFTNSDINTNIGEGGGSIFYQIFIPFTTRDTLYFTNTGLIQITPGMEFDNGTNATRQPASAFNNSGVIIGNDVPAELDLLDLNTPATALPGAQPSQVLISASNVVNSGDISVGDDGLLQISGSNVNLSNGSLAAGTVSETDANDLTGREQFSDEELFNIDFFFGVPYVNPVGVYDLLWGANTGLSFAVAPDSAGSSTYTVTFTNEFFPLNLDIGTRDEGAQFFGTILGLNLTTSPSFSFPGQTAFAYQSTNFTFVSNIFFNSYNVVFVNTNLGSNITVDVGFTNIAGSNDFFFGFGNGVEDIVRFSEGVSDPITGQTVSNSIYLLDTGAVFPDLAVQTNAAYQSGFSRPDCFEITTSLPSEWLNAQPANIDFTTNAIFDIGFFSFFNDAIYRAQVGRNPELLDGSFTAFETNFARVALIDVPDVTIEPGRLEISGTNLNLNNSRLRSEGVANLTSSNLLNSPLAKDWGNVNSDLNSSSGTMIITNIFPTTFKRLRGDITAWCGNEEVLFIGGGITNAVNYHILWVEPSLKGSFMSSVRNLTLRATNTIIQDNLRVIDNALILSSNLTLNAPMILTQNAGSLWPTNIPNLTNFFINTNGALTVDNVIDIGFNISQGQTGPLNRRYNVGSITNFGAMTGIAPLLQSTNFENDGVITATNGSIVIESALLGLGYGQTGATNAITNSLIADGNVSLSANAMQISNSVIFAGGTNANGRGELLLESTPTGQIADFVSGAPATNNALMNFWQVTDGFSLPVKPVTGDLFGTEITTVASNYTVALHTWAGIDVGATPAGFADNMVIGHLKLSRQSPNAVLHFTGAGAQNGMYVDFLDLDTNSLSYTDYRNGLVIDPNLTIYFAACNVNPLKLEAVYSNRLVWVQSFAGPNSTMAVPYLNSTNVCLMNSSLATSPDIAFFPPVPNSDNQPYVLNDPSNPTNFINCPTDITMLRNLTSAALLEEFNMPNKAGSNISLVISTKGHGTVSPILKKSQVGVGKQYTLSAVPSPGWAFSGWFANGLPNNVDTSARTLKFTIADNLVLTANFQPETFTLAKGTYYGLFTNVVPASDKSGWFTFTLSQKGTISGRILMGSTTYTFSAMFPTTGTAQIVAKHGSQSLNVSFTLNLADPTGLVTGTVTTDGSWDAKLLGYIAPTWTAKNPSPYAGQYTMVLTNLTTNAIPSDVGYASLSVSKLGALSVAGTLADMNAFSQAVPVSANGLWPFYTYVPRGGDYLVGWVDFQSGGAGGRGIADTNILWSKAASARNLFYPDGVTNMVGLSGSPYIVPARNSSGLTLTDPVIILNGGGLADDETNQVESNGKVAYTGTNLTLSINPAVGSFTGQWRNPDGGNSIKLGGVVLQNQESALGLFPGTTNGAGTVLLQGR